jgi:pimeloyl-ACP methyl ester carboxylesterase
MTVNGDLQTDLKTSQGKLCLVYGENNKHFKLRSAEYIKELRPDMTLIELKDAQHHLFLDRPIAFIDAVKETLAGWSSIECLVARHLEPTLSVKITL